LVYLLLTYSEISLPEIWKIQIKIPIKFFPSVYFGEFYWQTFPSLYSLVNTDESILLVYIEGIAMRKKKPKKYDDI